MDRLRILVEKIENGQIDVDELAAAVKEAAELVRNCRERLKSTENEVNQSLKLIEEEQQSTASDLTTHSDEKDDPSATSINARLNI
jgi:exodeoxyribonuclease VII small subunit